MGLLQFLGTSAGGGEDESEVCVRSCGAHLQLLLPAVVLQHHLLLLLLAEQRLSRRRPLPLLNRSTDGFSRVAPHRPAPRPRWVPPFGF